MEIRIDIPSEKAREVSSEKLIGKAFLEVLAIATGQPIITDSPHIDIEYDDYGPRLRYESYGDEKYGTLLQAHPRSSGIGVHGEYGSLTFNGLPQEIEMTGYVSTNMRGGENYFSLKVETKNQSLEAAIKENFGKKIKSLL